ncbi:HAD family hydrolase [Shewanella youngdeokensis]|uniref:HAD-IA family hydrolase n=1 Tax=Shewanella youngdeokensis TaxID=2999068 RepID=A0ABZ0K2P1_9GAMM|nr:HAD-IA family hydrolase [Shewanella sp. DAU334]
MTNMVNSIKPPLIKGVLFDLDGTLADTAPELVDALNLSLTQFGYPAVQYDALCNEASHGSLAMVQAAQPNVTPQVQQQLQQALLQHYQQIIGDNCQLFDGLWPFLALLNQQNIPFGVVTNKPARFTRPLLNKLGLSDMPTIVSGDSTLHSKPHVSPMLLAAQQLAVEPEHILYLGDAQRDMEAAHASNMIAALAKWGYIRDDDNIKQWQADISFETPIDLTQWLKQQF